jgi:site-specific DNA-methyltransferase (adenine-specific)
MLYEGKNYQVFHGDCVKVIKRIPKYSVDMVFADPPYKLSNDGITCQSGQMVCVNKGYWDKSSGFYDDYKFNKRWLRLIRRVLKPNGTIWISGTYHIIYSIGFALSELNYHIINDICWFKPNAAPNMGCRCFTASHETLLWAKLSKKSKHTFNYGLIKELNGDKQMRSVWTIPTTPKSEKQQGNHPTQKPLELVMRCILSASNHGDTILDPFCGSGTSGVAAVQLGRKFIGIEIEKAFVDLSLRRLETSSED